MEQDKKPGPRELSRDELREVVGGDGLIDRDTLEGDLGDLSGAIDLGRTLDPQ